MDRLPVQRGFIDDASAMNATAVSLVVPVAADLRAAEQQLIGLLADSALTSQKVSIAGSRHSMGGHTIIAGGIVLDTQKLIDSALARGGRYYLPYRSHASQQQFVQAYPMADEFFAFKRQHDPEQRFSSQWYLKYGVPDVVAKKD